MDTSMAISNQPHTFVVGGHNVVINHQARDFTQEIINNNNNSPNIELSRDEEIGHGLVLSSDLIGVAILKYESARLYGIKDMTFLQDTLRDLTWGLMHDADGKQRTILEVAKLFEEESARLDNMDGVTEEIKSLVRNNLERSFVEASRRFIQESSDTSPWTMESINNFARNVIGNIEASGMNNKTKSLMLEGLNEVVSFRHSFIYNQKAMEVFGNFIGRSGIRKLDKETAKAISDSLMKDYNEKYRQQKDEYKAMLLASLNKFASQLPSAIMNLKNPIEDKILHTPDEENEDEKTIVKNINPDNPEDKYLSENTLEKTNANTDENPSLNYTV